MKQALLIMMLFMTSCAFAADVFEGKIEFEVKGFYDNGGDFPAPTKFTLFVKGDQFRFFRNDTPKRFRVYTLVNPDKLTGWTVRENQYGKSDQSRKIKRPMTGAANWTVTEEEKVMFGAKCKKYFINSDTEKVEAWGTKEAPPNMPAMIDWVFNFFPFDGLTKRKGPFEIHDTWLGCMVRDGLFPMEVYIARESGDFEYRVTSIQKQTLPADTFPNFDK